MSHFINLLTSRFIMFFKNKKNNNNKRKFHLHAFGSKDKSLNLNTHTYIIVFMVIGVHHSFWNFEVHRGRERERS